MGSKKELSEEQFLAEVIALKDEAIAQGGFLSEQQISERFPELSPLQRGILENYFKESHIGIGDALADEEFLGMEDRNYLNMYLEELEELETPEEDMRRILAMNALAGDDHAREQLLQAYLKNVVDIARLYTGQGIELEDLVGEGNVSLAMAMTKLDTMDDPGECDRMVVREIMDAMESLIGRENDEVEALKQLMSGVIKVGDKAKKLSKALGRKVSIQELAIEEELTIEEVCEAIRISGDLREFIDAPEDLSGAEG